MSDHHGERDLDHLIRATQSKVAFWLNSPFSFDRDGRFSPLQIAQDLILSWARDHGVSRVAETTRLDRVGIPNFYAVRPSAKHSCTIVSYGKGQSKAAAQIGALFECFERWAAESTPTGSILKSMSSIVRIFPGVKIVAPNTLPSDCPVHWVAGFDPFTGTECLVPRDCIVFPAEGSVAVLRERSITDGIASGTNPGEAILAAIAELVERHAVRHLDTTELYRLDEQTIPDDSRLILEQFYSVGVEVVIIYCPSPTRTPVFYVLSRDDFNRQGFFFCWGSGCHIDSHIALNRALLELSQSRLSFISAITPDVGSKIRRLSGLCYEARRHELDRWFTCSPSLSFNDTTIETSTPDNGLSQFLKKQFFSGFNERIACVTLHDTDGLFACRIFTDLE